MGDFDRQSVPGKTSGVTADDLVQSPNIGSVAPGKINLVQGRDVGDQWIDRGAVCDGKDASTQGCFLSDPQRLRLIIEFKDRVHTASTNYKGALQDLRVDELMKKEDDLNWVLSLALDLAGAHLVVVASRALKGLRASGAAKLTNSVHDAARRGDYSDTSWSARAESALHIVTDARIDGIAKAGFDVLKKPAAAGAQKAQNHVDESAKEAQLSYIAQLRNGCDVAFKKFERNALGHGSDAELVVLWEGMHERLHTVDAYKAALAAKLERFRRSGVNDIGRKEVNDREFHVSSVHRDTRVVFVQGVNGVKNPWYQSQEGDFNPSVIKPCDPGAESFPLPKYKDAVCKFGPRDPREALHLDRPVPEEFKDVAIARSEQRWGAIETIEDPSVPYMKALGVDLTKGRQGGRPPTSAPPASLPANASVAKQPTPWAEYGTDALPANSIFAPAGSSGTSANPPARQPDAGVQSDPLAMFTMSPKAEP